MKEIKGFTDKRHKDVWVSSWKDPIYSTTITVLIAKAHTIQPALNYLETNRELDFGPEDLGKALCTEIKDTVYGHEVFMTFLEDVQIFHLVHECIHAKNFIFMQHGVKLDPDNDEHEAYYMHYLFQRCMDAFEDKKEFEDKQNKKNGRKGRN